MHNSVLPLLICVNAVRQGAFKGPRTVHVAVLPAMTGVSRFGEHGAPWQYSKVWDLHLLASYVMVASSCVAQFGCTFLLHGLSRRRVSGIQSCSVATSHSCCRSNPPCLGATLPHMLLRTGCNGPTRMTIMCVVWFRYDLLHVQEGFAGLKFSRSLQALSADLRQGLMPVGIRQRPQVFVHALQNGGQRKLHIPHALANSKAMQWLKSLLGR